MKLTIYQCDKCGADCSEYENRVMIYFQYGEGHELCIKCAREIFQDKEERAAEAALAKAGGGE